MPLFQLFAAIMLVTPAYAQEEEGSLEDYLEESEQPVESSEEDAPEEELPEEVQEEAAEGESEPLPATEPVPDPEPEPEPDLLENNVPDAPVEMPTVPEPEPSTARESDPEPVLTPEVLSEPEPEPVLTPEVLSEPEPGWQEPATVETAPTVEEAEDLGLIARLRPPQLRPWQGFTTSLLLEIGGMGTAFSVAWWWSERGDGVLFAEPLVWTLLVPSLGALGATTGVWLQGGAWGGRTSLGSVMGVGASAIWLGAGVAVGAIMAGQGNEYAWVAYVVGSALALISPAAGATVGGLWTEKDRGRDLRDLIGTPVLMPDGQGGAQLGMALSGSFG